MRGNEEMVVYRPKNGSIVVHMSLSPDQFKRYTGNPEAPHAEGYAKLPTRELVSDLRYEAERMNSLLDKGHGVGYDLDKMSYAPGKYNYDGHMALMVRDVAMQQRRTVDGLAAKGIKMPVLDMMDGATRENWNARRKSDLK